MISIKINDLKFLVKPEISILEACKYAGITIPRFCYHETLSIAGNCRMCLVELEGVEKPVASCVSEISEGISIYTDSAFVKKARENVVEALLLNHPLDCPICDQAGECDLQDQTKSFGSDYSRFFFNKRGVEDKECGPLIKTIMTRCIHCTRCVRFGSEVAGIDFLGTLNRGASTEIGSYVSKFFDSEISGNVIDLCPVGALTSKPYGFKARPWELRVNETVDLTDSTGSSIYVNFKESEIFRILPKSNDLLNEHIISDKSRFSYDSNNNNRVKNLFQYQSSSKKFKTINWTTFLNQMDSIMGSDTGKLNVVANDDIGLENIELLKKVGYLNLKVETYSLNSKPLETGNLYISGLSDKIKSLDNCNSICFIFSLNPKLESSVLNTRLRTKYRNSLLSLVSMGQSFLYNIPTSFVNLNVFKSLKVFEGKYSIFSKLLIDSKYPLIVISDSISKRGLSSSQLIKYLKSHLTSITILSINETANVESLSLCNIKKIKSKSGLYDKFICLNLDDTFQLRKIFSYIKSDIIWLNSHGSSFASKVKTIVPILSEYEEEKIFLNLEQRPQRTVKTFNSFFDARSIKSIVSSLFEKYFSADKFKNRLIYSTFLGEIVDNSALFDNFDKKLSPVLYFSTDVFMGSTNYVPKYPMKSSIEDFYCSNKSTKNSKVMQQSSQYLRKISSNFK
jgi:NADH-quinone oxidoreductase chain G